MWRVLRGRAAAAPWRAAAPCRAAAPGAWIVARRTLCAAAPPPKPVPSVVSELERLQSTSPWWQASLLRMGGVFSDEQWQAAAGSDLYVNVTRHEAEHHAVLVAHGSVPDRFYSRLQMRGLLCWLAHVRLRQEESKRFGTLFRETMEKVWQQAELDLTREFEMGYVQMAKHIKAAQLSWHGMCKHLDEALASDAPREQMSRVLLRNVYVDEEGEPLVCEEGKPTAEAIAGSLWLADYLLAQQAHQRAIESEEVLKGRLSWAPPPEPQAEMQDV